MDKNYTKKQVNKDILNLAWPSITEQMLIMMVGMVSTIFVGRIGTEAIAAVGMVNMIVFFLQTVFTGLATGSTVVIARIIGEDEPEQAKIALVQSLIMAVIAGVMITGFGYFFAYPILKLFFGAAEPKVLEIALFFFKIILISLPFLVVDLVIAGAVRGAGDTRTPLYVTIVVNIINLALCSTLVFGVTISGNEFIPALGVKGAAISVTVARVSGGIIRLMVLFWPKCILSLSFKDKYAVDMSMITRIIRIGLPAFLEQLVMQGGFLMVQVIVVLMGTVTAAVYQVGINVNSLAFMPILGLTNAATAMVGQSIGRRDYYGAEIYARQSTRIAIVIISFIGLMMVIFAKSFALLYSNDPQVIKQSISIIRMFGVISPMLAIMNVSSGVLRAAGDIMYVMVTSIVGLWSGRIGMSYLIGLYFGWGIYGVMVGICMDFGVRAAMYGLRVKAGKWKYLKV